MLLCDVIGRVWPERQIDGLAGRRFVTVKPVDGGAPLVAMDMIEAGVGTSVLVVTGTPARDVAGGLPIDAVVTAIVKTDGGR